MPTPFFCLFVKDVVRVWCLWERLSRNKGRGREKRKVKRRGSRNNQGRDDEKETLVLLSQSPRRPRTDEMNPQHHTIMQPLRTQGRTEKEQSEETEKVDLGHKRKSYIPGSDYSLLWLSGLIVFREH